MGRTSNKSSNPSATMQKSMPKKVANMKDMHAEVKKQLAVDPSADESPSQVDSKVPGKEGYEVVMHEGKYLSMYLNWSDLKKNHNKFYLVQVVQRKGQTGSGYVAHVFIRYGRVGDSGQTSFDVFDYAMAIKTYAKKTREK